jgi:nucleoside-diphosphate-sugar epimerase
MAKRVAITGATGFIGHKLLLRLLEEGYQVRVLSRKAPDLSGVYKNVHWFNGSLNTEYDLKAFVDGIDILFHCAGEVRNQSIMESVHVEGTRRLIEAAAGRVSHWVQLSSVGVYGQVKEGLVTETSLPNPVGEYEITKVKSDQILINAAGKSGFTFTVLRPSNVYGPSMTNQSVFSLVSAIERGLFFYIGKRGASANYIHVDNVVEALLLCATNHVAKGKVYNLSDYCTIEEFVGIICKNFEIKPPRIRINASFTYLVAKIFRRFPKFPLTPTRVNALMCRSSYPIDLIQSELGYQHKVSMEEGMCELVDTYKQQSTT